jgi:hypothetical protein
MACGRCVGWIEKGSPVQLLYIQGLKSPKVRCETCAEGTPPDDLPELSESAPEGTTAPSGMASIRTMALRFDARAAACGKDGE